MASKMSVPIMMSEALEKALSDYAGARNISRSDAARQMIADAVGYDLEAEEPTKRRTKYANAEERHQATLARAREQREETKALREAVARFQRERDVNALAESLGIDLADEAEANE